MDNFPVTLVVKAPNQQIEDQTIKCESSWTVNKLKQHLSEVYPSKPPKNEQKLIYSGQLLSDSLTLKDVLRQYEGQDVHTVHLVCTPKQVKAGIKAPSPETSQNSANNNPSSNSAPASASAPQTQPQPQQNEPPADNGAPNVPNYPWFNMNGQQQIPMDMNQYAMQMAWMQQAYLQYMTQYMQLAANSYQQQTAEPQPQPEANLPEQPPAPQPAPVQRDIENPERDWLDIFYMLSRAMILFSIVYFYSSPLRFCFVLLLGFSLYLYQIGFFRNINLNDEQNQENQAPSRLMIIWTFFTTFFASLIPEIPNAL